MNTMKDVYEKLKKDFKKDNLSFVERKNCIEIHKGDYEIIASESLVELSKKLRYINHKRPKDFNEIYKYTKKYIKDPEGELKKDLKQKLVAFIIALVLTIIIGFFIK